MNKEIYQIAYIVSACKNALQTGKTFRYVPSLYENSTKFNLLQQEDFVTSNVDKAKNVAEWFLKMKKRGMINAKLFCPNLSIDRELMKASSTVENSILCYFSDNIETYFIAKWEFNGVKRAWDVLYTECEIDHNALEEIRCEDNSDSFRRTLVNIEYFASQIRCENYAHTFKSAIDFLDGRNGYPDKKQYFELPQLPIRNLQIYEAASIADVFGGIGSWNDVPRHLAYERGLSKEYEMLSNVLFKNIRQAILYAINEW